MHGKIEEMENSIEWIKARLDKLEGKFTSKWKYWTPPKEPEARKSFLYTPCHNYQAGRYANVDALVYHYTAGASDAGQIVKYWNTLKSPNRVSAHYIINRDGSIVQCVKEEDTAWHAWKWNPSSIGIEICAGPAGKGEASKMTYWQQSALAWLTKDIMTRHKIKRITGHRFLGMNTSCPGEVFPTEESIETFLDEAGISV